MQLFKDLLLLETQKAAHKEIEYTISVINKLYAEWKKKGRRKNAVDIVTTTANKLSTISPETVDHIHEASKLKLATLLMRCMDIPSWKPVSSKEKLYKKLGPLLAKMQNYDPKTGTGGNLKEVIMTRMSAAISFSRNKNSVFVAYEPKMPDRYLGFIFGDNLPKKTYRMQALGLPEDFETLVDTLTINQEKAERRFGLEAQTSTSK